MLLDSGFRRVMFMCRTQDWMLEQFTRGDPLIRQSVLRSRVQPLFRIVQPVYEVLSLCRDWHWEPRRSCTARGVLLSRARAGGCSEKLQSPPIRPRYLILGLIDT